MARTPKPWFREDRQAYFVTVNGTRHNLGPDKKEAFRRFHELMAAPAVEAQPSPPPVVPNALTVGQVFEKFLDWCQQHSSPRTYEWTRDHIQRFCDHLRTAATMAARDIRPFHVVESVDSKKTWGPNHKRGAIVALGVLRGGGTHTRRKHGP